MNNIEWKTNSSSGVGGVYNPLTREVEWKTSFNGGVVGYYDYETQTVKWEEKWHHGLALITWNPNAKIYLTTAIVVFGMMMMIRKTHFFFVSYGFLY